MGAFTDISGRKYGKLTVLQRAENRGKQTFWRCKCECGNVKDIRGGDLKNGKIISCGCVKSEMSRERTHKDIKGMKFGRLTAIEEVYSIRGRAFWLFRCECGNSVIASGKDVRSGNTKSCGCKKGENGYLDGRSTERLYGVWCGMHTRCYNENSGSYKNYGGRGISIAEEWHDYSKFRAWAIANGYDESAPKGVCTIDRINNDGNYEPGNCRFVSMKVQAANKRKTKRPYQNRPVVQIDISNNCIIREYGSVTEAANDTGCDPSSIVKCCKGTIKLVNGHSWRYKSC